MIYETRRRLDYSSSFDWAGSADDIALSHQTWQTAQSLKRAQTDLRAAGLVLRQHSKHPNWAGANASARRALGHMRRALDFAEDGPLEETVHRLMDRAGAWVRRVFGCPSLVENRQVRIDCPVNLGHNRIGFSVGMRIKRRTCRLCGDDISECLHIQGQSYWVPGGVDDLDWCRVCGQDHCDHSADIEYRVPVIVSIDEVEFSEVSLVNKPANPLARIAYNIVPIQDFEDELGCKIPDGTILSCDKCLQPCEGLIKHDW